MNCNKTAVRHHKEALCGKNLYFIPDYYDSFYLYILRFYGEQKKKLSVVSLSSSKEYTLPLKAENILSDGNFRTYIKNYIKNPFELKNGFLCSIRILLMTKIRQIQT